MTTVFYFGIGAIAGYIAVHLLIFGSMIAIFWLKSWHRCRRCKKCRPCTYIAISCDYETMVKHGLLKRTYYVCWPCSELPLKLETL